MVDIYGIGNPLIDIVARVSDEDLLSLGLDRGIMRLIDEEERAKIVAFLESKEKSYSCGGSCPNTMIALASFGVHTCIAGKVGNDEYAQIYRDQVAQLPIESRLKTGRGPTGSSIILVTPDSERTMNTYLGVNRQFGPEDVDEGLAADCRYFYFTGYMWDTELQKEAILKAIEIAEKNGRVVVFDVADPFAVNRNRQEFLDLVRNHVSITFANREEAHLLFDTTDTAESARELSRLCDIAVVKNGARGSYIMRGDSLIDVPACDAEPVDTTGAGDMYAAGFLYGLTQELSLRDSGLCASYVASRIIVQHGAQFSSAEREAVAETIKNGGWDFTRRR
jgi:sugar/nucleoside kinase (ribokinase family)